MKKSGHQVQKDKFKELKRKSQRHLRRAYWSHVDNLVTNPDGMYSGMKRFWSYIKHQRNDKSSISSLRRDGVLHTDDKTKAEILNQQFQSAFSDGEEISQENFSAQYHMPGNFRAAPDIEFTIPGVENLLRNLNAAKAPGPDDTSPRILKELAPEIAPRLTLIFQKSYNTGTVPTDWRCANVTPIYKKGEKHNPGNYRPVSLTSVSCKIMEHVFVSNIMSHADDQNIFYDKQHGFRRLFSCTTQLVEFIDDITATLDQSKQVDAVIMDFAKAFDKVNHSLLVHKLAHYGIRGRTNQWIKAFLGDRLQSVVLEGEKSSSIPVRSGVPQGSVLGPCLFLYYINDINENTNCTVRLFADDTLIYVAVSNSEDSSLLQQDLDRLVVWADKWRMDLSP